MADLKDLKKIGEDLVPILKELFELVKTGADKTEKGSENRVIQQLKKLIDESKQPTQASLEDRAAAIVAARTALTEVLIQSASSNQALPEPTVRIIQTQRNALRNAYGLLLERSAFEDIPQLLSNEELGQISSNLENAASEIAQRQAAQKILETTVNVAILVAKIAVKLV
jgi:flagellar hook-basal body complex protein FliE